VITYIDNKAYADGKIEAKEILRFKLKAVKVDDKPINNEIDRCQFMSSTLYFSMSYIGHFLDS
jgi:hypothetical protein